MTEDLTLRMYLMPAPPTSSTRFARAANVGGRHQKHAHQHLKWKKIKLITYFRPAMKKNRIHYAGQKLKSRSCASWCPRLRLGASWRAGPKIQLSALVV